MHDHSHKTTRHRLQHAIQWTLHSARPEARPWLLTTLGGWVALRLLTKGCQGVDRLRALAVSSPTVEAPVFVLGHPRSGTTWLHRLLALDDRFCTMRLWEGLLPSQTGHDLVRCVQRGSRGKLTPLADRIDTALFTPLQSIHPTGLRSVEEDELLFLQSLAAAHVWHVFGAPELRDEGWRRDTLPPERQVRMLRDYRRAVTQLLRHQSTSQIYLSKNPFFAGWISTLSTAFPRARFILLSREPADAVASLLMNVHTAQQQLDPAHAPRGPWSRALFERSVDLIRHVETVFETLPDERKFRVAYPTLVRHPSSTITSIYNHFGWTEAPQARAARADAVSEATRRIPRRVPRLRSFGIPAAELAARLSDCEELRASLQQASSKTGVSRASRGS